MRVETFEEGVSDIGGLEVERHERVQDGVESVETFEDMPAQVVGEDDGGKLKKFSRGQ